MSFICNFTNDSDCSSLFENISVAFTAIQATVSIFIVLSSIPINFLLMAAMIAHRRFLDTSIIIAISVLISNIILTLFLTGGTVITSIARSWLLGYWGCQVIAFVGIIGLISRWVAVGLVSFDRFCRVFWPFFYQRHEKKVIGLLLILTWAIAIIESAVLWVTDNFAFNAAIPGCMFKEPRERSRIQAATAIGFIICIILGFLLPTLLYTIMYCKARQVRKRNRVAPMTVEDPNTASEREAKRRANRATLIYALMMVAFGAVHIPLVGNMLLRYLLQGKIPDHVTIILGYSLNTLVRFYVLGDVIIIITNKQQREAVKKLLIKWKIIK